MALLNPLRVAVRSGSGPDAESGSGEPGAPRAWVAPLLGGAAAATATLVALLLVSGIVGSLAERASTDWSDFFGVGASLWLLFGGGRLAADGMFLALTPLFGLALLVWATARAARATLPPEGPVRLALAAFTGGYAVVGAAATGLAWLGPATPVWWSLPLPLLGMPALALAIADAPSGRWEPIARHLPRVLRRSWPPAVRTTGLAFGVGIGLVLVAVGVRIAEVGHLYVELGAGLLGATAITAAQILALPNLGLWALAFLSGPGFTVTEGSTVTLGSSDSGLLPLVPVFGALPGTVDFGWYVALLYLLPCLVGAYAARRTLAGIPRLASGRTKLGSVAATVALTAALIGVLDGVAGGSLGDGRLAGIGPGALPLAIWLAVAMGLGAAIVVARDWWRLRR